MSDGDDFTGAEIRERDFPDDSHERAETFHGDIRTFILKIQ